MDSSISEEAGSKVLGGYTNTSRCLKIENYLRLKQAGQRYQTVPSA